MPIFLVYNNDFLYNIGGGMASMKLTMPMSGMRMKEANCQHYRWIDRKVSLAVTQEQYIITQE